MPISIDKESDFVTIKKSDLVRAFRESFEPDCVVFNSDVANDPAYLAMLEDRINNAGHSFGDVGAELERSSAVSEFSLSMIRSFFDNMRLRHG